MAGMVGEAYHRRPSEILGLDGCPATWRLHFDFNVLVNVRTMQGKAHNESDEAARKTADLARKLEKEYGKGEDAKELEQWLKTTK